MSARATYCDPWKTTKNTNTLTLATHWTREVSKAIAGIKPRTTPETLTIKLTVRRTVNNTIPIKAKNAAFLSVMPRV